MTMWRAPLFLLSLAGLAQAQTPAPPRLVVVIAIDQFRGDFLQRYQPHFVAGGFNLLLQQGANFTQATYSHAVTKTCPGHAIILTGSHPYVNGIVTNDWYNRRERRAEYCAYDGNAPLIGVQKEGRSPRNLNAATIGDVLRQETNGRAKVVTIAGKDRSAIMLGGHAANAAYWMEDTLFVTSRYYRQDLPAWVRDFNRSGKITSYFGKSWELLLPGSVYARYGPDDQPGERNEFGLGRTFPHVLGVGETRPGRQYIGALERSPFQNELVTAFATEAIKNEQLGADEVTDLLGISYSANDRVAHGYGPDSPETADITFRTDRLLDELFKQIDAFVGLRNTLIVLTADHGSAPMPEVLKRLNSVLNTARLPKATIDNAVNSALTVRYGSAGQNRWIVFHDPPYLYLNEPLIAARKIALAEAEAVAERAIEEIGGIFAAHTRADLARALQNGARTDVVLNFDARRSGSIMYTTNPYVLVEEGELGSDHGSPWFYDKHVPLVFFGTAIRPGTYHAKAHVEDIAPTLAAILRIEQPSAAQGRVLAEILR